LIFTGIADFSNTATDVSQIRPHMKYLLRLLLKIDEKLSLTDGSKYSLMMMFDRCLLFGPPVVSVRYFLVVLVFGTI